MEEQRNTTFGEERKAKKASLESRLRLRLRLRDVVGLEVGLGFEMSFGAVGDIRWIKLTMSRAKRATTNFVLLVFHDHTLRHSGLTYSPHSQAGSDRSRLQGQRFASNVVQRSQIHTSWYGN